jgi:hypothetical protein
MNDNSRPLIWTKTAAEMCCTLRRWQGVETYCATPTLPIHAPLAPGNTNHRAG